MTNETVDTM